MDFDLDKLTEIAEPYEAVASPRPPPELPSPSASRGTFWRRRRATLVVVLLLEIAWIVRAGVASRSEMPAWFVIEAFVFPWVGAVLTWFAFTLPGRLGLGLPHRRLVTALAVGVALFGVSALFAPESAMRAFTAQSTLACAATASLLAALPFAAGFFVFRRTLTGCAWLRMAIFGVACGSLGALLVRLHCPKDSIPHILLGHGAAILMFSLLGTKVGRGSMRVGSSAP